MVVTLAMIILGLSVVPAVYRMVIGPSRADRAAAGDLLMMVVIGLLALIGLRNGSAFTFDIVLVAALVGFISAISLARALTVGAR